MFSLGILYHRAPRSSPLFQAPLLRLNIVPLLLPLVNLFGCNIYLKDFHVPISIPVLLFCDNQTVVHIASNSIFNERTKHIELDCHFVLDKLNEGFLKLLPIRSHILLMMVYAMYNLYS